MPYSKEHKAHTRQKILNSAKQLFAAKGFDNVTIDEVMEDCLLTRGAFYAHFNSKSELYQEALQFAATTSVLAQQKPPELSNKEWLLQLLDKYLSLKHVRGGEPCPLAFLATDIVSRDQAAQQTYVQTYKNFTNIITHFMKGSKPCSEKEAFSLTAMIIGAVALARAIEDQQLANNILSSCRQQVRLMLGAV